jgi:hypothetical protein
MYGKALRVIALAVLAVAAAAPLLWHAPGAAEPAGMTLVSSQGDLGLTQHIRVQAVPAAVAATVSSTAVVSTPDLNGCTVTVGGEEKHGRWDGRSWCCVPKSGGNETCYNCDYYTCKDRFNAVGPGMPPREVEPSVP